jgi:hypothetical protein
MYKMRKMILGASLFLASCAAFAQGAVVIRGEESAGSYANIQSSSGVLKTVNTSTADPCISASNAKSSAVINISTATTTALVAPSGSLTVYVCSIAMTISQVVTTANTIKFVRGTGATCGTGTADLTGAFGAGGVTAAPPITVSLSSPGTIFKGAAADGICATTTIGASASFVGVITYVQQ